MDLAEVCRIFHPTSAQYTFLSAAHRTFSKIDNMLGHKASLCKYDKIEKLPCILFDQNALKLEINNNKSKEHANSWKLNNKLLNDQWVTDEIKKEIERFLEVNKNVKHNPLKPMGHGKGSHKRKVCGHECIY
jgi:hypothetical protein